MQAISRKRLLRKNLAVNLKTAWIVFPFPKDYFNKTNYKKASKQVPFFVALRTMMYYNYFKVLSWVK